MFDPDISNPGVPQGSDLGPFIYLFYLCLLMSASLSFAGKYYMLEQNEAKCTAGGSTKYGTGNWLRK